MKKRTYYDVLGVSMTATIDEIKEGYRKKAKEIHPDLHSSLRNANEAMVILNKAYNVLTDPLTRQAYNKRVNEQTTNNKTNQQQYSNSYAGGNVSKGYTNNNQNTNTNTGNKQTQSKTQKNRNLRNTIITIIIVLVINFIFQQNTNSNNKRPLSSYVNNSPSQAFMPSTDPSQSYSQTSIDISPIATPEPQIDCTGPDGKHLQVTQQECDNFNNAWATPTPFPTTTPMPIPPFIGCNDEWVAGILVPFCNSL